MVRAEDHQMKRRTHMMMARGVAIRTLAGSFDTYVTAPQGQSGGLNHLGNVRESPVRLWPTERNSLVANAAASEGDSSLKFIVIGFFEESPRDNLQNERRFNDSLRTNNPKFHHTLIFVPFSGFQPPIIRLVVTIVFARRSPNASSISSVGLGPWV